MVSGAKKLSYLMAMVITGAMLIMPVVQAAEAEDDDLNSFTMDQLIVTASRIKTHDLNTAAAVEVLTHEELVATGGTNIQEALKFGTGLYFQSQGTKGTSQGTMNSKIIIRGVEKGTLVLVDGVPLNQSGRYNLEDIPTDLVERVEIVRGGGSVLYGSEATGGVINIITKGKRENSVKTSFGNYGQQSHALNTQIGKLGFSYSYDKIGNIDNVSDPAGGRPVGNYYTITRGEHNNFNFRYDFNDKLYFSNSYSENNAHYVYRYKPQNGAVNKDAIFTVQTNLSQLHYDDQSFKAILSYTNTDQNNFTKARNKSGSTYLDTNKTISNAGYNDKTYGLDLQKNWKLAKDVAIFGVNVQRDTCDYSEDSLTVATNKYTSASRDYSRNMYSAYGQYNHALNNASNLIFSARETWTGSTKAEDIAGTNYSKFTPELEYINRLTESTSFYAKAGQSFMMPTFSQMFGSGNIIGNADLKPQHGTHYEVGLKKNVDNKAWRLAVYNYAIDDSIEAKWKSSDEATFTNEDVKNTGIELTCDIDMGKGLTGNWGVSYSNPKKYSTITENNVTAEGRWRDYYGKLQLNGGLSYTKDKWNGAVNLNYLGKRTRDLDSEESMKPYLYTNLNVAYKPDKSSKVFLNVDNLLNRQDITTSAGSTFYTLGRNFMLGYEHTF